MGLIPKLLMGVILIVALGGAILFWGSQSVFVPSHNKHVFTIPKCEPTNPESPPCLKEEAEKMARDKDIKGAIAFAVERIAPQSRQQIHRAMHSLGHIAYTALNDRVAALAFLPPDAFAEDQYLIYEGFVHGVFMAYFNAEKQQVSFDDLIKESCGSFFRSEVGPTEPGWRAGKQCFHAVGHALMFALGNKTKEALQVCKNIPYAWAVERCGYGVLMELEYLYLPQYDPQAPRPDISGESLAPFCDQFESFQEQCRMFIGRSYLRGHLNDYQGAFLACEDAQSLSAVCRREVITIFITEANGDFRAMKERCAQAGPQYELECLATVSWALKTGYGGEKYRKTDFCAVLDDALRPRCYLEAKNLKNL